MRWLVLTLMLTGCEILDFDEDPVDVSCRAQCADCEQVILECNGKGRGINSTSTKVTQ